MAKQRMIRKDQPRPRPNSKQAAKGGRSSTRRGVRNGQSRKGK